MPKTDINAQIEARVREFTAELSDLIRQAAMEAVQDALIGNGAAAPRKTATRKAAKKTGTKRKATTSRKKGGRRARRSEAQIQALAEKVMAHVAAAPGQRLEEIGKAMNMDTGELKRPIANLLEEKALRTTGQRRGTKYFVAKGRAAKKAAAKSA